MTTFCEMSLCSPSLNPAMFVQPPVPAGNCQSFQVFPTLALRLLNGSLMCPALAILDVVMAGGHDKVLLYKID